MEHLKKTIIIYNAFSFLSIGPSIISIIISIQKQFQIQILFGKTGGEDVGTGVNYKVTENNEEIPSGSVPIIHEVFHVAMSLEISVIPPPPIYIFLD